MKHTDYKNIIEAAKELTKSKAQTKAGAWKALRGWIKTRPKIGSGTRPYYALDNASAKNLADYYGVTTRDGYYIGQCWGKNNEIDGVCSRNGKNRTLRGLLK